LPVRTGFPVNPDNVGKALPEAVRIFADHGLKIYSIASDLTEPIFQACAEAGVPLVRICVPIPKGRGYMETETARKRDYAEMVPWLEKYGVTVGIQNHCDRWVANAMGIRHLIEDFAPRHFSAVWDAAHGALSGEDPDLGLDIVWSHLRMVNLKNARWERTNGPEATHAEWRHYWCAGREGLASWPWVARELAARDYRGPVCFTAEYSDEKAVDRLIVEDLAFARGLFAEEYARAALQPSGKAAS
jgi:sugar phosphate isomerase/epimerase